MIAKMITAEQWDSLRSFYGLEDGPPRSQLLLLKGQERSVALVSAQLADIVLHTEASFRVVSLGVRAFTVEEEGMWKAPPSACRLRITQDGAWAP